MADCEPDTQRFMDLTVPEYAYMFGFLQADGHLAQGVGRKGRLTVEIKAKDVGLLRRFRQLTPYYSSITERTRATNFSEAHRSAVWILCSLDARTALNDLGLPYGSKSRTVAPPTVAFARRDYLRGVVDADGSVGRHAGRARPAPLDGTRGPCTAAPGRRRGSRRGTGTDREELLHPPVAPAHRPDPDARPGQPFTQMNCFSFATTSTRSRCCSITWSMFL
ncbi:hypothetical protein ACWC4D_10565 [Streptomyces sp. NPDC001288]|uniref:hypothetical protein n=1 Tax=Streptomyces sp. NPDC001297 TaxID=3364559 RepID=UPI0036B29ED3